MKHFYHTLSFAVAMLGTSLSAQAQCTTAASITTIAGNHTNGYSGDGGASNAAQIGSPYCVAADASGNFYIADHFNNVIRKVSNAGVMTTIAGTGVAGYNGDNIPAIAAQLNGPAGVTLDGAGNIYIADKFNERIRKISPAGTITTIAGNGFHGGYQGHPQGNGGPATAAALDYPLSVALDCSGNIYIADNGSQTVRKIFASGIIVNFAGTAAGGYNGDNIPATAAQLNSPHCVAADCAGNVYIADAYNNRIRKVDASGTITTVVGNGSPAYSGDGGPATSAGIWIPWGITLDGCGNMYICDYNNNAVRKVSAAGTISTFAGSNARGYSGDGGIATASRIYLPSSLAIDGTNRVYIADYGNFTIRLMGTAPFASRAFVAGTTQDLTVCQDAPAVALNDLMAIPDAEAGKTRTWTISGQPEHGTLQGFNATAVSKSGVTTPTGLSYTPEAGYTGDDEFTILMSDGTTTASTTVSVKVTPAANAGAITRYVTTTGTDRIVLLNETGDKNGTWASSDNTIATVDATGTVTPVMNGAVTISYTVSNSCGEKSATTTVVSQVHEVPAATVNMFPNPNNGSFRCEFMSDADATFDLVATDISGKVVYKQQVPAVSGINNIKVTLPAAIQRPSIVSIRLGNKDMHFPTATISVTE